MLLPVNAPDDAKPKADAVTLLVFMVTTIPTIFSGRLSVEYLVYYHVFTLVQACDELAKRHMRGLPEYAAMTPDVIHRHREPGGESIHNHLA